MPEGMRRTQRGSYRIQLSGESVIDQLQLCPELQFTLVEERANFAFHVLAVLLISRKALYQGPWRDSSRPGLGDLGDDPIAQT
jgi:hypothetical protein